MNVKYGRILAVSVLCADCLPSSPQIENVDACLSFLDARGVNVQGLSAEGKKNKQYAIQGLIKLLIEPMEQQKRALPVVVLISRPGKFIWLQRPPVV